ncbi:hypothetical protein FA95DRAFT_937751 [Auriscalpium vulgare]|uniref:Uncharacterized protein n=1 Tax=Auriscalpium vulgare TaxID=40419 RepID=A0ACB8S9K7_9AGAM|nr:hypothetical protein FA95DRAFT_937751 [Auriscalpium vulgare]
MACEMDKESGPNEFWSSLLRVRVPMYDGGMTRRAALAQGMTAAGVVRAEIDAVVGVLLKLRVYENALVAPVFAMPSKILMTVFSFCVSDMRPSAFRYAQGYNPGDDSENDSGDNTEDESSDDTEDESGPSPLRPVQEQVGWMSIAQVCHHWRNVTLNTPSL